MLIKIILLALGLLLTSCHRTLTSVTSELKSITGEAVTCFDIDSGDSGWLCRSESKKYYYCPYQSTRDCWFTTRLMLLDPPVEAPVATH